MTIILLVSPVKLGQKGTRNLLIVAITAFDLSKEGSVSVFGILIDSIMDGLVHISSLHGRLGKGVMAHALRWPSNGVIWSVRTGKAGSDGTRVDCLPSPT